jgi:hypothetical protein
MNSEELCSLIRNAPAANEAVRDLALVECVAGGSCYDDRELLPLAHWHQVWSARARRLAEKQTPVMGVEAAVSAFAALNGSARCVNLKRAERTVLVWFSDEGHLLACIAY